MYRERETQRSRQEEEEAYNLDSDYQPAHKQEGGNIVMATETRQCHVKPALCVCV